MRKIVLTLTLLATAASAATVEFRQSGWSDGGGPLFVSFTGTDADLDGNLVLSELTSFSASWTTQGGTTTGWDLAAIEPDGFFFTDLQNYLLFARNSDYSLVGATFEGEALASVFDAFLFPVSSTGTPAEAIPEPATFGLAALVLIATFTRAASRRARQSIQHLK